MYQDIDVSGSASFEALNPQTTGYANEYNFRLNLVNCPLFSQTITNVQFPGINLGSASFSTPILDIKEYGDKLEFENITATYNVLDDISNYLEIYTWMMYIGGNDNDGNMSDRQFSVLNQLKARGQAISNNSFSQFQKDNSRGIYTDASLILYNKNNNPIATWQLQDVLPISLSGFDLLARSTSLDPLQGTATFTFTNMKLDPSTDSQRHC